MKHFGEVKWSRALSWTCAAVAAGIAAAYTPALGNGSTWSLPYSGSVSSPYPAITFANTGTGYGVQASSTSIAIAASATGSSSTGVLASGGYGVYGQGTGTLGEGVYGTGNNGGVIGVTSGSYSAGVSGSFYGSGTGYGVTGMNGSAGVYGYTGATSGVGVSGYGAASDSWGILGSGGTGVQGNSSGENGTGVYGRCTSGGTAINAYGTSGSQGLWATSDTSYGAYVQSTSNIGVYGWGTAGIYGQGNGSGENNAGHFAGNVLITGNLQVNGTINKSAVGFKIDHPLDPAHKFLMHSCIESNEMMNIYSGNEVLDSEGSAVVTMPDWFQAENTDYRYQLSAIGKPAPGLYVSKEIENNQFEVAGGAPGTKISWQVTGARNDKYAIAHPLKIEVDKGATEQGKYMRPDEYGQPETKMIGYVSVPQHTQRKNRTAPKLPIPTPPRVPPTAPLTAIPTTRPTAAH